MHWFDRAALLPLPVTLLMTLLMTLVACGVGADPGTPSSAPSSTVTVTARSVPRTTAPRPVTVAPSAAPVEAAEHVGPVTGPPAVSGPTVERGEFSSPTGNIWCSLAYAVECVVQEHTYPTVSDRPCEAGDWIDAWFTVGPDSGVRGDCRSDTPFADGRPRPLDYGTTAVAQGRACTSETTGMTCWDTRSGHGFRVSRASYDLFGGGVRSPGWV